MDIKQFYSSSSFTFWKSYVKISHMWHISWWQPPWSTWVFQNADLWASNQIYWIRICGWWGLATYIIMSFPSDSCGYGSVRIIFLLADFHKQIIKVKT